MFRKEKKAILALCIMVCSQQAMQQPQAAAPQTVTQDQELQAMYDQMLRDVHSPAFKRAQERDRKLQQAVAHATPYGVAIAYNIAQEAWYHGKAIPKGHLAHATLNPLILGTLNSGVPILLEKSGLPIKCPKQIKNIHPQVCECAAIVSRFAFSLAISNLVVGPSMAAIFGEPHTT